MSTDDQGIAPADQRVTEHSDGQGDGERTAGPQQGFLPVSQISASGLLTWPTLRQLSLPATAAPDDGNVVSTGETG